jgi:hypothetical protein
LVEHHIETGDAKPLKQPPRRVPMAYAEDEASPSTVSCLISTSWSKGFINLTLFVTSCVMSTRQEAIATGYFSTKKLFGSNK